MVSPLNVLFLSLSLLLSLLLLLLLLSLLLLFVSLVLTYPLDLSLDNTHRHTHIANTYNTIIMLYQKKRPYTGVHMTIILCCCCCCCCCCSCSFIGHAQHGASPPDPMVGPRTAAVRYSDGQTNRQTDRQKDRTDGWLWLDCVDEYTGCRDRDKDRSREERGSSLVVTTTYLSSAVGTGRATTKLVEWPVVERVPARMEVLYSGQL